MPGTGNTSIKSYNFFLDSSIQGAGGYAENGPHDFVDTKLGIIFTSQTLIFSSDSTVAQMWFSFDGVNDHGMIDKGETLQMDFRRSRRIWFRGTPGVPFRFWAY